MTRSVSPKVGELVDQLSVEVELLNPLAHDDPARTDQMRSEPEVHCDAKP